jgi:hypothetical protein
VRLTSCSGRVLRSPHTSLDCRSRPLLLCDSLLSIAIIVGFYEITFKANSVLCRAVPYVFTNGSRGDQIFIVASLNQLLVCRPDFVWDLLIDLKTLLCIHLDSLQVSHHDADDIIF